MKAETPVKAYEQVLENMRNAVESGLKMQQDAIQHWIAAWPGVASNPSNWMEQVAEFQKKWLESLTELSQRHRANLDQHYKATLASFEQALHLGDASSPEEFREQTGAFFRKSLETVRAGHRDANERVRSRVEQAQRVANQRGKMRDDRSLLVKATAKHQHVRRVMQDPIGSDYVVDQTWSSLVDVWSRSVEQAAANACGKLNDGPKLEPGAWRSLCFESLAQETDVFLRSPPFLHLLKNHVETLIAAQRAAVAAGTHLSKDDQPASQQETSELGGGPWSQDIAVLHSRLQQLGQRIEGLASRLKQTASQSPDSQPAFTETAVKAIASGPKLPARESRAPQFSPAGATPSQVVFQSGKLRLLRYVNPEVRFAEPVLICFALVNRPYILDLDAKRSVVRHLLARGFDVYLIDWGVPGAEDHHRGLADYVCVQLHEVVQHICQARLGANGQASRLNLLGYCMGGTMATMFTRSTAGADCQSGVDGHSH